MESSKGMYYNFENKYPRYYHKVLTTHKSRVKHGHYIPFHFLELIALVLYGLNLSLVLINHKKLLKLLPQYCKFLEIGYAGVK